MFGENLTVAGVDVSGARIGERWRIGAVELEVCAAAPALREARHPLRRSAHGQALRARRGGPARTSASWRPASSAAGDAIEVVERPGHDVTVALVSRAILLDETLLAPAAAAPALPAALAGWMRERAA